MTEFQTVCSALGSKKVYQPATPANEETDKISCCEVLHQVPPADKDLLVLFLLLDEMLAYYSNNVGSLPKGKVKSTARNPKEGLFSAKTLLESMPEDNSTRKTILPLINEMLQYYSDKVVLIPKGAIKNIAKDPTQGLFDAMNYVLEADTSLALASKAGISEGTRQKISIIMAEKSVDLPAAVRLLLKAIEVATPDFCAPAKASLTVAVSPPTLPIGEEQAVVITLTGTLGSQTIKSVDVVSDTLPENSLLTKAPVISPDQVVPGSDSASYSIGLPPKEVKVKVLADPSLVGKKAFLVVRDREGKELGRVAITIGPALGALPTSKQPKEAPAWVKSLQEGGTKLTVQGSIPDTEGVEDDPYAQSYVERPIFAFNLKIAPLLTTDLDGFEFKFIPNLHLANGTFGKISSDSSGKTNRFNFGIGLNVSTDDLVWKTKSGTTVLKYHPEFDIEGDLFSRTNEVYPSPDNPNTNEGALTLKLKNPIRVKEWPWILNPVLAYQLNGSSYTDSITGESFTQKRQLLELGLISETAFSELNSHQLVPDLTVGVTGIVWGKRDAPDSYGDWSRSTGGIHLFTKFQFPNFYADLKPSVAFDWKRMTESTRPIDDFSARITFQREEAGRFAITQGRSDGYKPFAFLEDPDQPSPFLVDSRYALRFDGNSTPYYLNLNWHLPKQWFETAEYLSVDGFYAHHNMEGGSANEVGVGASYNAAPAIFWLVKHLSSKGGK